MKKTLFQRTALVIALMGSVLVPLSAQAQNSPWLVRVRAVNLDSSNKDSTGLGLSINDKVIPEVDISYFFSPNLAAELVLTYPQKQDIRSNGTNIGSFKHLPPTLTAQYHFTGMGAFKPYVGAGVNYTLISSVKFAPAVQSALQPSLEKNSFGFAVQAGFDYEIAKNTYLNLDIKKVQIRTDVKSAGTKVGEFKIDPVLLGVGVGWRF
ncbi:MAG: OmpW/AlkL family protein [Burkholderiaceae bacterium]|jgi:outer membrane protein